MTIKNIHTKPSRDSNTTIYVLILRLNLFVGPSALTIIASQSRLENVYSNQLSLPLTKEPIN
jgi:hypothetical protein